MYTTNWGRLADNWLLAGSSRWRVQYEFPTRARLFAQKFRRSHLVCSQARENRIWKIVILRWIGVTCGRMFGGAWYWYRPIGVGLRAPLIFSMKEFQSPHSQRLGQAVWTPPSSITHGDRADKCDGSMYSLVSWWRPPTKINIGQMHTGPNRQLAGPAENSERESARCRHFDPPFVLNPISRFRFRKCLLPRSWFVFFLFFLYSFVIQWSL